MLISAQERYLCGALRDFPKNFNNRYGLEAKIRLQQLLFRALVNNNDQYLAILFNHKIPASDTEWLLREAQGSVDGSEYAEQARGKACGHIFKSGEATYRCKTCTLDDTCVLCSRCFEASDHTGHMVFVTISPGNSGCCDCGDEEAWRIPVNCAIHTARDGPNTAGKQKLPQQVPEDLAESIRMTIGRVLDYMCDVISCSPEKLNESKTEKSIAEDERKSRLTSKWYEDGDEIETNPEYALVLWNDEKHSVQEVQNQVARACKKEMQFGLDKARETDDIGRSVVIYSRDLEKLLHAAAIIEKIKITVTIRSARDTFREQMCSSIVEWMLDITGCTVGPDGDILRQTVCKEMLKLWRAGSQASNASIGKDGIDDHELDESRREKDLLSGRTIHTIQRGRDGATILTLLADDSPQTNTNDRNDDEDDADSQTQDSNPEDLMELDLDLGSSDADGDLDMRTTGEREPDDDLEASEATMAGYPPPPPPPPAPAVSILRVQPAGRVTSSGTDGNALLQGNPQAIIPVPKTPSSHNRSNRGRPPHYWTDRVMSAQSNLPLAEDVTQRVRLDLLILFDLRLWKKARVGLRDLYIGTVVTVPEFKRILGLRFAGLYTVLAQLYLIADREPDHSIIYLSLQMLTTPSITEEVVAKGNFLTNLMAILYTFLTTRQVDHPWMVDSTATLAFDAGSVTNRRMYHFFMDLKHLFASEYVQECLRRDDRYVLQFMDLIKLAQGICPNTRAVGEHVEYETDAWISASLLTRELNRLCRQFAEAFRWHLGADSDSIRRIIRLFAQATIINSTGVERKRFEHAEVLIETRFKDMNGRGFELEAGGMSSGPEMYHIVDFVVDKEPISFHHALHYTLSWLVDGAKSMLPEDVQSLLAFSVRELQEATPYPRYKSSVPELESESYLMALFDFPIRVCAWLSQMKAGMWVRNGLSLRHQMSTYRGVAQRDLAHQRDIFLLQTALVVCNPSRVLMTIIDRYGMEDWMTGRFTIRFGFEDTQLLDVAEDFIHLLIVLLIERTSLQPAEDEPFLQKLAIRRDITHILCFKPLSFSDLCSRLADKFQDLDEFQDILQEMTNFRPPEGLSDTGTFELKQEYLSELDPYILHYSKNQRDEAETVYRNWVSKKTGKPVEDVVLEPRLRNIKSGLFKDLSAFTRTKIFAQIVANSLRWAVTAHKHSNSIPTTRVEAYLQVVLHLILSAVLEDYSDDDMVPSSSDRSFVYDLLFASPSESDSVFMSLQNVLSREDLKGCHPKTRMILLRVQQKRPQSVNRLTVSQGITIERLGSDSPMAASVEDLEAKKKQALDRQAKVMAQFQKQQQDFLSSQNNIDWGEEDFDETKSVTMAEEGHKQLWKYPSGNCILCQEETNDSRLYGTFGLITESDILRQTDMEDMDYVQEVLNVPSSLDRSAEAIRPFGVAGQNRRELQKLTSDGREITGERQGLGKGFNAQNCRQGPVSTGCGHIMHYNCFELYCGATVRRQGHQIARNHPERLDHLEFVCPLCKALGNTFLPIIWRGKEEAYPSVLQTDLSFDQWLHSHIGVLASRYHKHPVESNAIGSRQQEVFASNIADTLITPSTVGLFNSLSRNSRNPNSPLQTIMHYIPGMPGGYPAEDQPPTGPAVSDTLVLEELWTIYGRIRDTVRKNNLHSRFAYELALGGKDDLAYTDVLASALGFSISATEIAQRGVESEPGSLLLDKISPLTLTHLRILSETVSSYIAIGGSKAGGQNRTSDEFLQTHTQQLQQLFIGHPQIYEEAAWRSMASTPDMIPAALSEDVFVLLVEASVYLVPALRIDIHHIIHLCYLMETVKVILSIHCSSSATKGLNAIPMPDIRTDVDATTLDVFSRFLGLMEAAGELAVSLSTSQPEMLLKLYTLVSSYSLAFLRKTAILLHVRYGVDFPSTGYTDMDESELSRLTKALRLPTLPQLFEFVVSPNPQGEPTVIQSMMRAWIAHWRFMLAADHSPNGNRARNGIRSSHPGIFELIGLPKYYDILLDEMMRRRCPRTGKELVEPAICLFCGDIFCSQAVCCGMDKLGGCNQHMRK